MSEVVEFISEAGTFYIATVDGNVPKVRPFGLVIEHEGKIYFCTSNQKAVYKQLEANPNFEVSTTSKDNRWIRLKGKAVFENNFIVKAKAFEILPHLKNMYNSADNPNFVVFYVSEGEATIYSFSGETKTYKV